MKLNDKVIVHKTKGTIIEELEGRVGTIVEVCTTSPFLHPMAEPTYGIDFGSEGRLLHDLDGAIETNSGRYIGESQLHYLGEQRLNQYKVGDTVITRELGQVNKDLRNLSCRVGTVVEACPYSYVVDLGGKR